MKKELLKIQCPECGEMIDRNDLTYYQEGDMSFDLSFNENDEPIYDEQEFTAHDGGRFCCGECGVELSNELLLKLKVKR